MTSFQIAVHAALIALCLVMGYDALVGLVYAWRNRNDASWED